MLDSTVVCRRALGCEWGGNKPTTKAKPVPKHRPTATQAATRSRSLLSRSRVSRAVEAARRVGGGLIVAALNVGGLRAGAGAPTDAGSERPAGREGDRRAEQRGTPLRGPARLVKQPVRHSAGDPSRESCRMKVCASEPRAPRTLTAKVRSRKRGAPGWWAGMVYRPGAKVCSR